MTPMTSHKQKTTEVVLVHKIILVHKRILGNAKGVLLSASAGKIICLTELCPRKRSSCLAQGSCNGNI